MIILYVVGHLLMVIYEVQLQNPNENPYYSWAGIILDVSWVALAIVFALKTFPTYRSELNISFLLSNSLINLFNQKRRISIYISLYSMKHGLLVQLY